MGDDEAPYRAYPTLAAARADPDATVVLEGDYGGQIYLTCPVCHVACDEHALLDLLEELDRLGFADPDGAALVLEHRPAGSGVGGGMGGAVVVDGPWLHPELDRPELAEQVADVLAARRDRIAPGPADDVVWTGDPPWDDAPPTEALAGVVALLASAPDVLGRLELRRSGAWRLWLPHPAGGVVVFELRAEALGMTFDGLAAEAAFDFADDLLPLTAFLAALLDRGLSVRTVRVGSEEVAVVVGGTDGEGSPLRPRWDHDPAEVDWLRASLGPVEPIGPLRRG